MIVRLVFVLELLNDLRHLHLGAPDLAPVGLPDLGRPAQVLGHGVDVELLALNPHPPERVDLTRRPVRESIST